VTALVLIGSRSTPVLLEKQHEMTLGLLEVVGIHRTKYLVSLDDVVEGIYQSNKELIATDLLVHRTLHASTLGGVF
jgi:hypothetical protein